MPNDDESRGSSITGDKSVLVTGDLEPWQDRRLPAKERVRDLLGRMTVAEKVAQLYGVWAGVPRDGDDVAPFQHELIEDVDWPELIRFGLGQLTRPFGTAPVDAAVGAMALARIQGEIVAANRFGIPAVAHEECLSGFMTWGATVYPAPLAWGASFDPELVERMAAHIGEAMRGLGVHQGMAPVLDVTRDPRWGRTEETMGEDPYLVATVGTGYVRGLQSAGIIATLKHFAGHAGSRAGRNMAPVGIGRRELADIHLPPFLLAVREGGARSVMHSYSEVDGMPPAADHDLLTGLLRETWGFDGTVVGDYFGVTFLEALHHIAGSKADAAGLALAAGLDVELPTVHCFGEPLQAAIRAGTIPVSLIDTAAERVLRQKCELGLLDPDWRPVPPALDAVAGADGDVGRKVEGTIELDPPAARAVARELAEESVVLLVNDGTLPLHPDRRIALVGPQADTVSAMLGCYTFPSHVGIQHPEVPLGVDIPTLLEALADELPSTPIDHAVGCDMLSDDTSGIPVAVSVAERADVCVVALGDRSGLFGRGTSGEGCDAEDLRLPGAQEMLLEAVLDTGTPVVLVLLSGRPYALGPFADRLAAVVQAFFPGEEGGPAVAGVLSGRVNPSGRLPIGVPRDGRTQPAMYLSPPLAQRHDSSSVDPTPLFPFGHGLAYTSFEWTDVQADGRTPEPGERLVTGTDGSLTVSVLVRNTGERAGTEVVQLYLHDPVAQVTRPVVRLIGYARVRLEPGESRRVGFGVHADLSAFTGRRGAPVVEAGDLELRLSSSSVRVRHTVGLRLVGEERVVDHRRRLTADVVVE
ncbi:MAG TPA: glycoside hydrolase family 3 N-terminal domain-containing protein [Actinophytocola sp.]|uniref:beta-xylosidase/alpha-l-arabinosidase n=1 Tax=Actinophytocola sp. TaxID=1872138 RepID=UPI002DDD7AE7|nr:glycoside hydrolase family 3 N-terminal domain-containing protein [Actinophytocola sp.]HEV2783168.1 glycoside hydrolase family 3 N-terminal domain-containing protein [Actinophytocola sp.]